MERSAFLARVRAATGARAPGGLPRFLAPSPTRDRATVLAEMAARWRRPHATWREVPSADTAHAVVDVLQFAQARRVVVSADPWLDRLGIAPAIQAAGITLVEVPRSPEVVHGSLPQVDAGVTVPTYAVAETATLVEVARPEQPRALSLVPPVHVAVLRAAAVLSALDDLFAVLGAGPLEHAVSCISGASGTADIGLQHITGVHGPGDVHVIVVTDAVSAQTPE
ncbi:MAG TPA: LUD domain-containing protein [bacterium]|nr:LUD domain-containing protein [bacterium]